MGQNVAISKDGKFAMSGNPKDTTMSGSVTIHNSESVRVYDWGTLRKNEIKQ